MKREGGTKSNFSPFLTFFRATSPLSPTSTLSIAIFCGGSPHSDSHSCSAAAFSRESASHPHGTPVWAVLSPAPLLAVVTEHRIRSKRRLLLAVDGMKQRWEWIVVVYRDGFCERVGMSVVWRILEASAMANGCCLPYLFLLQVIGSF